MKSAYLLIVQLTQQKQINQMKTNNLILSMIVAIGVLVPKFSISQGQLIDRNINLPGPNTGLLDLSNSDFNSTKETYYLCGRKGKAIIELDANTNIPIARIDIKFAAGNIVVNPLENKLYASENKGDSIVVVDCSSNTIIKYIQMPDTAYSTQLLYNPISNKVYCGRNGVHVIDCANDIIIKHLSSEKGVRAFTFNSVNNKIYVAMNYGELNVIDGYTDNIVKTLETTDRYTSLCFNSINNKVYCSEGGQSLLIIDGLFDTIIENYYNHTSLKQVIYNPESNKIYAGYTYSDGGVLIIDGETNEVTDIPLDDGAYTLLYNPVNNTVYASPFAENYIYVFDGESDDVVNLISLDDFYSSSFYNPVSSTVVLFDISNNSLLIIDAIDHTVEKEVPIGLHAENMCYNNTEDVLYVIGDKNLIVVDAKNNIGLKYIYLEGKATGMLYVEDFNILYIIHQFLNILSVIDCENHELLTTITLENPAIGLTYCSSNKRIYCSTEYSTNLSIINCETSQVIEMVPFPYELAQSYYHQSNDQLYLGTENGKCLVLNCSDNSIESQFDNFPAITYYEFVESFNTLYVASVWGIRLGVINCNDNSSTTVDYEFDGIVSDICYNNTDNKLYIGIRDTCEVAVMDCSDYSFIPNIKMENQNPWRLSYQPEGNRVLVANNYIDNEPDLNWLYAIDGSSNEIVQSALGGFVPTDMLYEPVLKKSYISYLLHSGIHVVNDTVILSIPETKKYKHSGFEIEVYPNPVINQTSINYKVKTAGQVDVALLDIRGKQVCKIFEGHHNAGLYKRPFEMEFLPAGVYLLRISSKSQFEIKKIILSSK